MKPVRTVLLSLALLALAAAPASAATPVLANDKYKWFYWIGPFLALSFVGMLVGVAVGYYIKVLRPKWRGREPS